MRRYEGDAGPPLRIPRVGLAASDPDRPTRWASRAAVTPGAGSRPDPSPNSPIMHLRPPETKAQAGTVAIGEKSWKGKLGREIGE